MPGFFSSNAANRLTSLSGYFLDWSRVGSLIAAGQHRYSWYELAQRGFVITSMAMGAYAGYQYSDEDITDLTAGLYSMAGCFVAFIASHCVVIVPLIYKRALMQQQCQSAEKTILLLLTALNEAAPENEQMASFIKQITSVIGAAMELNLSDDTNAKASQTWGIRARLMDYIVTKLTNDVEQFKKASEPGLLLDNMMTFWTQPQSDLHKALREFVPILEDSIGLKLN